MNKLIASAVLPAFAATLAACSGSDPAGAGQPGPAWCAGFSSAEVIAQQVNCSGCTVRDPAAATDGDLFSASELATGGVATQVVSMRTNQTDVFPAGSQPGAFVTLDGDDDNYSITFNTYLDDVLVENAPDSSLNRIGTAGGTDAMQYVTFEATAEFDELELVLTITGTGQALADRVFELCGAGGVD